MKHSGKLILIRHGRTKGNLEKRYVGVTEESILPEEYSRIEQKNHGGHLHIEKLFVSPKIRCIETAERIYPQMEYEMISEFRECDFGDFEYGNYQELSGDSRYQAWIDSNGTLPFPNGEDMDDFKKRCQRAFQSCVDQALKEGKSNVGLVVHGGTIMAILDEYAVPHKDYFQWQVDNLEGYTGDIIRGENQWLLRNVCSL